MAETGTSSRSLPVLWHLDVSHFNEKVRWALAWKGVSHRRRTPVPGAHMAVAAWLTRGRYVTFPVLELDGRRIGDSTAIVAALEERHPDPPLYPSDPDQRRRALQLEDFFDEELGPHMRQVAWFEFHKDHDRFVELMRHAAPGPAARLPGAAAAYARVFTALRFRATDPARAEEGRAKVLAALDRLEEELGDDDYLVGDRFSVADLTAASLFYPLVQPEEGPIPADEPAAAGFERFREPLKERRGFRWVAEMFRRHREPTRATSASAATG